MFPNAVKYFQRITIFPNVAKYFKNGHKMGQGAYHTVGHDGDDDDPFKGRPGDKPDEKSPEKREKN